MDASNALNKTHARRIPLVDSDEQTGKETILSVLTQYRLLKFIAINVSLITCFVHRLMMEKCAQDCAKLTDPIGSLGIGTYTSTYSFANPSAAQSYSHLKASTSSRRSRARSVAQPKAPGQEDAATPTAANPPEDSPPVSTSTADDEDNPYYPLAIVTLSTKIEDVVHMFSELGVSGVPVIDTATGKVLNLYETIDVVDLVRQNAYSNLDLTIEQALTKRSKDFPGVAFCTPEDTLADVLNYIRDKRVHRMVIVNHMTPGSKDGQRLVGVLTLSDVLRQSVSFFFAVETDQMSASSHHLIWTRCSSLDLDFKEKRRNLKTCPSQICRADRPLARDSSPKNWHSHSYSTNRNVRESVERSVEKSLL